MGVLIAAMPDNGTGNTDEATFERMPDTLSTARCPHCGQEHPWRAWGCAGTGSPPVRLVGGKYPLSIRGSAAPTGR
jgi:hypothetical protein